MEDFVGFTFNGVHSSEFSLKVTSSGDRYKEDLTAEVSDTSIAAGGMEGELFVKETIGKRTFPVEASFDNLSEVKFRELRKWLRTTEPKQLIFDERPYKVYYTKVSSAPQISYLCFTENEERVYKGELSITFISYYPYAISRYKDLMSFTPGLFPNKYEWAASSGLINDATLVGVAGLDVFAVPSLTTSAVAPLMNPGDKETSFKLILKKTDTTTAKTHIISLYENVNGLYEEITINKFTIKYNQGTAVSGSLEYILDHNIGEIEIDVFKRTIVFIYTNGGVETRLPIYFAMTEGDLFKIPVCKQNEYEMRATGFYPATPSADLPVLTYNYLYY